MRQEERSNTPRRRSGAGRAGIGRIVGLFLLLGIVCLPMFPFNIGFFFWDSVPVDGFAASTAWKVVNVGPETTTLRLYNIVGHNTTGTNEFQVHESGLVSATNVVSDTIKTDGPITFQLDITTYGNLSQVSGGCCGAPHAVCDGNGACTTAFTGADGRFREMTTFTDSVNTQIIDPGATGQLSATVERVVGAIAAATSNTIAQILDIYLKQDSQSSYTQVASTACDPPTMNLHFATTADPFDNWLTTACRNGSTVRLRQFSLPQGTLEWSLDVATVAQPNAFRYIQLDHCGDDFVYPDQSTGSAVGYAVPRNNDTVVGVVGDVDAGGSPQFQQDINISGTVDDYYAMTCNDGIVTLVRADPDGSGMQFVYVNFGDLSNDPNVLTATDDSETPIWTNTPPDYTNVIIPSGATTYDVDNLYLPLVIKTSSPLEGGGQVKYGSVPTMIFFDGFESGDTSFWSQSVGLAPESD